MRRSLATAAVSLAAGLPLAWGPRASCDGFDTHAGTHGSVTTAGPDPNRCLSSAATAMPRISGAAQTSSSRFDITLAVRYLPGAVHALAESPATSLSLSLPLDTAYRISLLQPIMSYVPETAANGGPALTADTLRGLEAAAVAGFAGGSDATQVVTVAWALAWAGHQPGQRYLELLQAAAASGALSGASQRLGPAHRAVLLWCAAMHGAAPPPVWESGLRAIAAAAGSGAKGLDEVALLYLLHAALLYGTDVAPPGRRTAAAPSGPGAAVSPTSPASASAASPACQPRATREEVLAAAAPLGRKALARLAAAYGEYVPLHPAIEGPYLALLYVLEQLAVGGSATDARSVAAAAAAERWVPPGAAEQAAAVLANPKELARVKRDLLYHWRGDTLVDEVQRTRNQVVYLLTRRLGLTVSQPEDVDVAVPSRWLAIYVRASGGGPAAAAAAAAGAGGAGSGAAVPEELEDAAAEALEVLLRDRFAPQVRMPVSAAAAGAAAAGSREGQQAKQQPQQDRAAAGIGPGLGTGPAGMWAARVRQLRRLGWRVVVVDVEAWRRLPGDAEREAYLSRLLRGRA